jgi:plasmid maintenance system antidote protein VapI
MNSNEMKATMKRNSDTLERLAEALGLHVSGVSERVNGRIDFRASEISKIVRRYNLSPEETTHIFVEESAS